jgi:signal transduction histidine kinase
MNQPITDSQALATDSIQTRLIKAFRRSRKLSAVTALVLVLIVGFIDYVSGYQIYWSIFYLAAIAFAAWNVGMYFACIVAGLSIMSWLIGDWAAGVVYPNRFVPIWNALITLSFYIVVIWLLSRLKSSHQVLETRIRDRTLDLQREIGAREQLEKDVAEVTERERLRIGHELHDTVCQHLTATSLSLQVLSGKLAEQSLPQTKDANQAAHLVESAIDLTRNLAKGLFPLELEGQGLGGALLELCHSTAERHHIKCEFTNTSNTLPLDSNTATHLYRIAQEAITNAIKHGHVSRVDVDLSFRKPNLELKVIDDGIGLPEQFPPDRGLGLRVMRSRAEMIGGDFSAKNNSEGGVTVTCQVSTPRNEHSRAD